MLPFLGQKITIRPLVLLQITFFPDQHPKVWWPIDDMHINRVDIFKYVSREKCEGKNVFVSSVL